MRLRGKITATLQLFMILPNDQHERIIVSHVHQHKTLEIIFPVIRILHDHIKIHHRLANTQMNEFLVPHIIQRGVRRGIRNGGHLLHVATTAKIGTQTQQPVVQLIVQQHLVSKSRGRHYLPDPGIFRRVQQHRVIVKRILM